jgi:hypothetical protein
MDIDLVSQPAFRQAVNARRKAMQAPGLLLWNDAVVAELVDALA